MERCVREVPPLFAGGGDLSLAPRSPCIGAGKDGTDMGALPFTGGTYFLRGDTNEDGFLNISDAIATLAYLFQGGLRPACLDSADANDDGKVDLTDAVYTLIFLFMSGEPIPAPYPLPGTDLTPDDLPCSAW